MNRSLFSRLFLKPVLIVVVGFTAASPAMAWSIFGNKQNDTLTAFESEAELNEWLAVKKSRIETQRIRSQGDMQYQKSAEMAAPMAMMAQESSVAEDKSIEQEASESITNTQTAGVDEGGHCQAARESSHRPAQEKAFHRGYR